MSQAATVPGTAATGLSGSSQTPSTPTVYPLDTVKLISSDGFEFVIDKRAAMVSGAIRNMLSSPARFAESLSNEVRFRDIKALLLERVCQYLQYHVRNADATGDISEFAIAPEEALELLFVADFLDC